MNTHKIRNIDYDQFKDFVYHTLMDYKVDGAFVLVQTPLNQFVISYGTTKRTLIKGLTLLLIFALDQLQKQ